MRDFQLNFFFNLGSHMGSHGNAPRKDSLKQAAQSRARSCPSKNRPAPQRCLAHIHSIRLFFPHHRSPRPTPPTPAPSTSTARSPPAAHAPRLSRLRDTWLPPPP